MKRFREHLFIILLFFITPSLANQDIIEERIYFFKKSDSSLSIIKKSIKLEDFDKILLEGKFIYEWSLSIPLYFPEGTHASMENNSDASYDIWVNFQDFIEKAKVTENASFELIKSASKKDLKQIKINLEKITNSCTSCHRSYRN